MPDKVSAWKFNAAWVKHISNIKQHVFASNDFGPLKSFASPQTQSSTATVQAPEQQKQPNLLGARSRQDAFPSIHEILHSYSCQSGHLAVIAQPGQREFKTGGYSSVLHTWHSSGVSKSSETGP